MIYRRFKVGDFEPARRAVLVEMGYPLSKTVFTLNDYPALQVGHGARRRKIVYVHRLVAQHFFGAALDRKTVVHHRNEDRSDFRVDNLEVTTLGAHSRHHCILAPQPRDPQLGRFISAREAV